MSHSPAATVVIPVFNGGSLLDLAVQSVLDQTMSDFELVAVDDGSTDQTPQRLAAWAERDDRVRVITRAERGGHAAALQTGCDAARAGMVAILDADDLALPRRLQQQVALLEAQPELVIIGSGAEFVDERGAVFAREHAPAAAELQQRLQRFRNPLVHSSFMFRREPYVRVGGYRAVFSPAQDFDLILRLSEIGGVGAIPEPLVQYRWWGSQTTARSTRTMAISSVLAAELARLRRESGKEPVDVDGPSSAEEILSRLGVPSQRRVDEELLLRAWVARTNFAAGRRADGIRQLGRAAALVPRASHPRRELRRLARTMRAFSRGAERDAGRTPS